MKLAIVIPYYNGRQYIERCIASLDGYPSDHIYIVDNSDIRQNPSLPAKYIDTGKSKLGFAAAVNMGLQKIYTQDFSHVLVLNQDAYFQKAHFSKFLKQLNDNIIYSFASPMIYTSDFSQIMPFIVHRYFSTIPVNHIDIPDFVAVALVVNLDLMKKLKGFDESFYMYYEDNDLIARSGIKNPVKIFPNIHVGHENPDLESAAINKEKEDWIRKSRLKYLRKHGTKTSYYMAWLKEKFRTILGK